MLLLIKKIPLDSNPHRNKYKSVFFLATLPAANFGSRQKKASGFHAESAQEALFFFNNILRAIVKGHSPAAECESKRRKDLHQKVYGNHGLLLICKADNLLTGL
ncbi:hypothetical protein LJC24_00450 [Desulfococcaceae bacterium OttesenSCG-928-F15]|nr:hypothetical protein [Desulfococcaceae bacterium OttesenSCG-928-F15]